MIYHPERRQLRPSSIILSLRVFGLRCMEPDVRTSSRPGGSIMTKSNALVPLPLPSFMQGQSLPYKTLQRAIRNAQSDTPGPYQTRCRTVPGRHHPGHGDRRFQGLKARQSEPCVSREASVELSLSMAAFRLTIVRSFTGLSQRVSSVPLPLRTGFRRTHSEASASLT